MVTTEIISLDQAERWRQLVEQSRHRDLYFMPEYLALLGDHMSASCYLYHHATEDGYILFPFFKRKVVTELPATNPLDIVSPWYYGGALTNGGITPEDITVFESGLEEYCRQENIVSEFTRFHPYLGNHKGFLPLDAESVAATVWIDLRRELEDIYSDFTISCQRHIRKSRKIGLEIRTDTSDRHLQEFYRLYIDAMDARKAGKFYYFSYEFLVSLRKMFNHNFILLTVRYKNRMVGGKILLHGDRRMYDYLTARDPEYPETKASNRMVYEAVAIGKQKGLEILDLGGGPAGSGLLQFKQGFSKHRGALYARKIIYDREAYQRLCISRGLEADQLQYEKASYFPEYRS